METPQSIISLFWRRTAICPSLLHRRLGHHVGRSNANTSTRDIFRRKTRAEIQKCRGRARQGRVSESSRLITVTNFRYLLNPTPIVETASVAALNNLESNPHDDAEGLTTRTTRPGHVDGRRATNGGGDDRDKKRRKMNKKDKSGQNKGRVFPVLREATVRICRAWESTGTCEKENCKWAHSWDGYFAVKPFDIHYEINGVLSSVPVYVPLKESKVGGEDEVGRTVDLATECPVYKDLGYCPYAWRCRFLGGHVRRMTEKEKSEKKDGEAFKVGDWVCEGMEGSNGTIDENGWKRDETNWPSSTVLTTLRNTAVSWTVISNSNRLISVPLSDLGEVSSKDRASEGV